MPWNCLWGYQAPAPTCRVSGPLHLLLQVYIDLQYYYLVEKTGFFVFFLSHYCYV